MSVLSYLSESSRPRQDIYTANLFVEGNAEIGGDLTFTSLSLDSLTVSGGITGGSLEINGPAHTASLSTGPIVAIGNVHFLSGLTVAGGMTAGSLGVSGNIYGDTIVAASDLKTDHMLVTGAALFTGLNTEIDHLTLTNGAGTTGFVVTAIDSMGTVALRGTTFALPQDLAPTADVTFHQLHLTDVTNPALTFGGLVTQSIQASIPASSRVIMIPDGGGNSNLLLSEGAQTIHGNNIFTSKTTLGPVVPLNINVLWCSGATLSAWTGAGCTGNVVLGYQTGSDVDSKWNRNVIVGSHIVTAEPNLENAVTIGQNTFAESNSIILGSANTVRLLVPTATANSCELGNELGHKFKDTYTLGVRSEIVRLYASGGDMSSETCTHLISTVGAGQTLGMPNVAGLPGCELVGTSPGFVQQATSITTTVVFHQPSGVIRTVGGGIAPDGFAQFTFTNSYITADGGFLMTVQAVGGGTVVGMPLIFTAGQANGTVQIFIKNILGGGQTLNLPMYISFLCFK